MTADSEVMARDFVLAAQRSSRTGAFDLAVYFGRRALLLDPAQAEVWHLIGIVDYRRGRLGAAAGLIERATAIEPGAARYFANLALVLREQGALDRAIAACTAALTCRPDYPEAQNTFGLVLKQQGAFSGAADRFRRAVICQPEYDDALTNLGNAQMTLGESDVAVASGRRAVRVKPDAPAAWNNLAVSLANRWDLAEAIACNHMALSLKPDDLNALCNLGTALIARSQFDAATTWCQRAIDLRPNDLVARRNLGTACLERGRQTAAIACFRACIAAYPDDAESHWLLAIALLMRGQYREGWEEYEWRWKRPDPSQERRTHYVQPQWSGEAILGGSIFLWPEQGFGDAIQFVRYVPELVRRGWRVHLAAPEPLLRLFQTLAGVSLVREGETIPDFDVHCPLLSLPRAFGTTVETIPAPIPYLRADPDCVAAWRRRLGGGVKIGIAWRGNPGLKRDHRRSTTPAAFAHFLDVPGITVVSLQTDGRADEFAALRVAGRFVDAGPDLHDFADTAGLMANLDLVIGVDTAVCHLAGALGVATWTLVDFAGEWRWLFDRSRTPWYPTMRLFKQPNPDDWQAIAKDVRRELETFVRRRSSLLGRASAWFRHSERTGAAQLGDLSNNTSAR